MLSCKNFTNLDYHMACQFDVLNSQEYNAIPIISAIVTTCKLLPDFNDNQDILDSPVVCPQNYDSVCSQDKRQDKRLCNMFTYSHNSEFGQSNIRTCSCSEQSPLIEQYKLAIAGSTDSEEQSTGYHRPKTIDLFIYPDKSTANQLLYDASANDELHIDVRDQLFNFKTRSSSVEVNVYSNRTASSILLPSLGTTSVIHLYASNLDYCTTSQFDEHNSQEYNVSVISTISRTIANSSGKACSCCTPSLFSYNLGALGLTIALLLA